ncbi:beta-ketoacyl synthase N-terminal-like domain-containing protein [Nocardia sp. NPDC051570]|uniref:beta-ketoacyl synthase N-terminal-like domain-containing protein n=1 Tax=Nocardia sp. NPDC051570 TaxID=3364324 RepID=UPI003792508B
MAKEAQEPVSALPQAPIAIVGVGGLFPQSHDAREFWANILDARDCIEEVPENHWRIADYYDPDPAAEDKTYSKVGGFLPTVDFDPVEFGIPPSMLGITDAAQLLSLIVAKRTFTDAGAFDSPWYDAGRTGVVLGATSNTSIASAFSARLVTPQIREAVLACGLSDRDADHIVAKYSSAFAPWEENSFPGMLGNVIAGRIANRFDLGGMNCVVDAACASSLAAVRMCVDELVSGRADLMLTGGCDVQNTIFNYLCFSKTPAFSKTDRIRPFDRSADGTLSGEGIGMLALRRLADAERDGNRIYATLRGVGAASDGRYKSIYAPRREGQVTALQRAYAAAGFGADQVALVECHGTGTPVGDATELTALRDVYAGAGAGSVAVGSVKSQIGHTKAAAGAAGLIKAALALHHKVLPPSINVDQPVTDLDGSPFYVNTVARPWILDPGRARRRAAVSAFGFGGTNFHCVLEEYTVATAEAPVSHRVSTVHCWHAGTVADLLEQLETSPEGSDAAEPIPAHAARLTIVASDPGRLTALRTQAIEALRADAEAAEFTIDNAVFYRRQAYLGTPMGGKIAALFAGQGSQYPGMGATAAIALTPLRLEFDAAALAFEGSEALGAVVFPPPAHDSARHGDQVAALRRTEYAQPAIGALSAGQYKYLTELGFRADGAIGHSFGELTALWAAGSLTDAEFRRLAGARGAAMAARPAGSSDPGTLVALSCDLPRVRELMAGHPDVYVCNINAPDQVVVGGGSNAVSAFTGVCAAHGVTVQELSVAAAFHTPYVAHAVEKFQRAVSEVTVSAPDMPVYPNMADAQYGADTAANGDILVRQLTSTVYFAARIAQMYQDGYRIFVEFGPGTVLSGLVRRTLRDRDDVVVLSADGGRTQDSDRQLKQLAARLLVLGMPLTAINRYTAPAPPEEQGHRMRVPMDGANYVPPNRLEAHDRLLHDGYVAGGAATGASPAMPVPAL